ncbi:MAG: carbon-nitrogen hydrolase family protein [Chloroflexi bacterium]|nr:carbon-nitrogen hydrolase family protein [Chloroflexota bacterium]
MADTYPKFTVAAVQAASVMFDRDRTIDKAVRLIEEAADRHAVIIGFPELFVCGHPANWYSVKDSNPLAKQAVLFKELVKNAVKVPSPATDRLCTAAKKARAYVVIGISELDVLYPGTLYLSQLVISDEGEIMGVHRKMAPTSMEKLVYSNGDGSYLNVYDSRYGKLSAMNCGEHAHDLYKYALLAMGTQIHVASWPSFPANLWSQFQRDSVDFRVRQFAHEGKIFILSSCAVTDQQNIEACCDTEAEKAKLVPGSGGGSAIIGPEGQYLAGPVPEGEAIVTAEISLEDALPGKQVHDVLGNYTRWDVLSLHFNRERLAPFKPPVESNAGLAAQVSELRREIQGLKQAVERIAGEQWVSD